MTQPMAAERPENGGQTVRMTLLAAGRVEAVVGYEGEALLFALKRAGLPLAAVCGGKGACGTCRVHVPEAWRDRLPPPFKRELRLLDFTKAAEGDRLSCRIPIAAELDGLEIHACTDTMGDA